MILHNNITEEAFKRAFPQPFVVRALSPWEALRAGKSLDRTNWRYVQTFDYLSDRFGLIRQDAENITDFASVPLGLHGLNRARYDDDSPLMLYPSGPHDLLFQQRPDGTRGWLPDGRQLSLSQVNFVYVEAMWYCGATANERAEIYAALEVGNLGLKHQFAQEDAK